jgi:PTH2 family peptidyl-tRNA hydrolase
MGDTCPGDRLKVPILSAWMAALITAAPLPGCMKQAIVARTDVGMGQGKLAAQVAHASLSAYEDTDERTASAWKGEGQKKVVLKGDSERQLFELADVAERKGLPNAVVRDAGHTQLEPGTVTALAVGPGDDDVVDAVTGDLSLY